MSGALIRFRDELWNVTQLWGMAVEWAACCGVALCLSNSVIFLPLPSVPVVVRRLGFVVPSMYNSADRMCA